MITYDVVTGQGRPKATAIAYAGAAAAARKPSRPTRARRDHRASGSGWLGVALFFAIVAVMVWRYDQQRLEAEREHLIFRSEQTPPLASTSGGYQCAGKQHCSQMASCDEARFYLQHCPDTRMDGDGDGEPCEDMCR